MPNTEHFEEIDKFVKRELELHSIVNKLDDAEKLICEQFKEEETRF